MDCNLLTFVCFKIHTIALQVECCVHVCACMCVSEFECMCVSLCVSVCAHAQRRNAP